MPSTSFYTLIVAIVAGMCSCQEECSFPTNDDLERVIAEIIETGDGLTDADVNVMRFHPVCLAFGQQQNHYRFVSVVVEYTCSGISNCPSGTAVEQIESECVSGVWSNEVEGNTDNTRSTTTEANFTTTTRENCSFCLSTELADILGPTTHSVTHCVGEYITNIHRILIYSALHMCLFLLFLCTDCNSACNEGLMRCFGFESDDCCNFYNNSMCVDECISPFVPNTVNECACPVGTTGHNCSEGE